MCVPAEAPGLNRPTTAGIRNQLEGRTAMAATEITDYIVKILMDKYGYPEAELELDASFEELDFDSLVLTELAGMLNRAFGIDLVHDELAEAGCIGAVGLLAEQRMVAADGLAA